MRSRIITRLAVRGVFWTAVISSGLTGLASPGPTAGSSGQWTPAGTLAGARTGAAAVLLGDGRVLMTGGTGVDATGAAGALSGVELFVNGGGFGAAAPMHVARSGHAAVRLRDGRVLVAGGTTADGETASAEIYDPGQNTWTPVGALADARSGHTASLLGDGRVVIAGGERGGHVIGTIEIFNPATGSFTASAAAAIARKDHAAATLADGRVLIAGGADDGGPLASIEIYDASSDAIVSTVMSTPRRGLSATRLLDGTVLIAGGHDGTQDVDSAEIFDPVAGASTIVGSMTIARHGHQAFLLPENNGVLIVGGLAAGAALADAEMFRPSASTFIATGSLNDPRVNASGTPLLDAGKLLVAGGVNGSGVVASAERYAFATVRTDKDDYAPGETVTITGEGFEPGEIVTLRLHEAPHTAAHDDRMLTAEAGADGRIFNNEFAPEPHDFGVRFYLTATGSRAEALNTFTDGELITGEIVGVVNDVTVTQGATANFTIQVSAADPIKCTATQASPATATVRTVFAISATGVVSSSTPSTPMAFFAGAQQANGQNCDMRWTGYPTPYSVNASFSAAATTPIGTYTIQLGASFGTTTVSTPSGNGSNLVDATPTAITVHVTAPADSTPPVVDPTVSGTLGANGWYVSDVTVSWTVSDSESSITSSNGCATTTITTDTAGTTLTCTATSAGGTTVKSVTVKRDVTPPAVALTVTAGTAGDHGWYTSDVTVHTSGTDSVSAPVTCTNDQQQTTETAGTPFNGSCTNDAGLTASASPLTIKLDKTAPTAELSVTAGTAGAHGWYTSDVTVHTNGTDSLSTPVTCTSDQQQTTETTGTAFNGTCTNDAGLKTNATPLTIKLDKTAPTAIASSVTAGTAGAHGWYVSDVTVHTVGADDVSGPVDCAQDQIIATETPGQAVNASCTNQAGLSTSAAPLTIKLDKTGPSAELAATGTPGANGWFISDVTVHATGSDTISGPVTCTADQHQTAETAGTAFAGSCTNDAGLTTNAAALMVKVDKTAPSASLSASGTVGLNGWYTSDVTITTSGSDSISGPVVCTNAQYQTADTTGATFNGSCTNNAGLVGQAAPINVKVDKTAPVINIIAPLDGGAVVLNASVPASYSCSDARSGAASCGGTVANGVNISTTPVGAHTFTVTATDKAGNSATAHVSYGVRFATGLCLGEPGRSVLQPINADGSSVFKQKSTVPVKFRVCDANGVSIGTGTVADFRLVQVSNGTAASTVNEPVDSTTPDATFRWDPSSQQWIFNTYTKSLSASMTYTYLITLTDSTMIQYQFGLK
jgi:hypothetical protein